MQNPSHQSSLETDFHRIHFSKASPEAIRLLLDALNAEVKEAVLQRRIPTLEGAFRRLGPASSRVN